MKTPQPPQNKFVTAMLNSIKVTGHELRADDSRNNDLNEITGLTKDIMEKLQKH